LRIILFQFQGYGAWVEAFKMRPAGSMHRRLPAVPRAARAALLCAVLLCLDAAACPNCKNAQPEGADSTTARRMSDGYFWSYLAMSAMPFLTIGGLATMILLSRRKATLK
jgi:hypothetical protein